MSIKFDKNIKENNIWHSKVIPRGIHRILIIGSSGTGKTYNLLDLLPLLHKPEYIIIFCKTLDNNSQVYGQIKTKYEEVDTQVMMVDEEPNFTWIELNREPLMNSKHNIVIIDDVDAKMMKETCIPFFTKTRTYNTTVILLYQRFYDIPKTIRDNTSLIFLFATTDSHKFIYNSFNHLFNDIHEFKQITEAVYSKKYNFMYLNMQPYTEKYEKIKSGFYGILKKYI